ncbi:hypothetical protein EDB83DRAFT_2519352 [Lactarius deliciosus]|nr:hypothetical protein EDB83DRAFT_2519352 [Lactarius deliciosus]
MTSRTLLPPNASAEAAVPAIPSKYVPAIHSSHADSRVPGLTFAPKLPQIESSHPPCLPRTTTSLTRPSSRIPRPLPVPQPLSLTPLDGLLLEAMGNNFTSPSPPPQNPKAGNNPSVSASCISASWFLASNEDPFPQPPSTPPPRSLPPPHATVDAEPIRAQRGREKRQRCSSVGSVAASDVSGDGRVVMTLFKFSQEAAQRRAASVAVVAEWLRM